MDDVTTQEATSDAPAPAPAARTRRRLPRQAVVIGILGVLMFLVGGFGGSYQGRLGEVQKNDNAAYLPATAESTRVSNEQERFSPVQTIPGFLQNRRQDISAILDALDRGDFQTVEGLGQRHERRRRQLWVSGYYRHRRRP